MSRIPIGIDLGTTHCCVGAFINGAVEIFDDRGSRTISSCVMFTANGRLVGNEAMAQQAENPKNTIFDSKRMLGRRFRDPVIQQDMETWPFRVIEENNQPMIEIEEEGRLRLRPEQISGMLLLKMRNIARRRLGGSVRDAVITVPAYFNDAQRKATLAAAKIAELNVLSLVNEPTAAGLAYGLQTKTMLKQDEYTVLVYDFGGGTLDVSIMTIEDGRFEIVTTFGDTHLGGQDIDAKLLDHCMAKFSADYPDFDISRNDLAKIKLRQACERAKQLLTVQTEADIIVPSIIPCITFRTKISRAKFNDLSADIFQKTFACVQTCLDDTKRKIDQVVMVGGSSRILKLQEMMQAKFPGVKINTSIDPDEAIAYGAALHAASLMGLSVLGSMQLVLSDAAPLSLGVEVRGGLMSTVVKRNCPVPVKLTQNYTTIRDNQTSIIVKVFEGERGVTAGNVLLGQFTLKGIPPAPKSEPSIDVTFEVNANNILIVTAVDAKTKNSESITIENDRDDIGADEMAAMIEDGERYAKEDQKRQGAVAARNRLNDYAVDTKKEFQASSTVPQSNKEQVAIECDGVLSWLSANEFEEKDVYDNKHEELRIAVMKYRV